MNNDHVRQDEKERSNTVEHIKLLRNRLKETTKSEWRLKERLNDRMATLERLVEKVLEHQMA